MLRVSKQTLYASAAVFVACVPAAAFAGTAADADAAVVTAAAADAAAPAAPDSAVDVIVVTGTRDPKQTARKSVSPIIVVSAAQLQDTGAADLKDALVQLGPSITTPRITTGAGNLVQKINLRTLTSNQTLILINGKRRHTTAVLADTPGPENGSSPVDLGMIPVSAIDHVEILQDGAAALYGSDAIAGVINIILKSKTSGGTVDALNSNYYAGDGFSSDESASYAMKLGDRGFIDLAGEYHYQAHTNRGDIDNRVGTRANLYFGLPQEARAVISYNAGYDFSDTLSAYSYATFGHREGQSFQNYRPPTILPQVYPNGYSPLLIGAEYDFGLTGGLKGRAASWDWDFSTTYGGDSNHYNLSSSTNQSLYKALGFTPTTFYLGSYSNTQWTNDLALRRGFALPFLSDPLSVSFGGQYRVDTYVVGIGDQYSYYGAGTDGVSGLPPSSRVQASRQVEAGYIDLSTRIVPQWQVSASGRYENYSDSEGTPTGKISTRYDFNPMFAIRGTVSDGFRAPTMAEEHYSRIGVTSLGASGTLAFDSPGAKLLGAPALKPERSMNYSASLLVNPIDRMHITIDAYEIEIKDRIVNAGTANGAAAIAALNAQGLSINSSATASAVTVSYFTNAADTRTAGVDFTAGYFLPLGSSDSLNFDLSANLNHTQVTKVDKNLLGQPLLSIQGIAYISTYFPASKVVLGIDWQHNKWSVDVHEIQWGPSTTQRGYYTGPFANSITVFDQFYNETRYQTNIEGSYKITPNVRVSIGANNLFNVYPNKAPPSTVFSGVANYEQVGQGLDVEGGYYYAALHLTF